MTHALRLATFASVRLVRSSLRLTRAALAVLGLACLVLAAMDPGPVLREAQRRAWRLHAWVAVDPVPPAPPLHDAPPIHWPCDAQRVSSGFGTRIHPITGRSHTHRGIDVPLPEGSPVRAARPGRVTRVARDDLNGLHVVLEEDEHALRFAYAHLSSVDVQAGDLVQAGDVLARSGNTGRSTGPHLHFGAWRRGAAVDPRRFRTVGAGATLTHAAP